MTLTLRTLATIAKPSRTTLKHAGIAAVIAVCSDRMLAGALMQVIRRVSTDIREGVEGISKRSEVTHRELQTDIATITGGHNDLDGAYRELEVTVERLKTVTNDNAAQYQSNSDIVVKAIDSMGRSVLANDQRLSGLSRNIYNTLHQTAERIETQLLGDITKRHGVLDDKYERITRKIQSNVDQMWLDLTRLLVDGDKKVQANVDAVALALNGQIALAEKEAVEVRKAFTKLDASVIGLQGDRDATHAAIEAVYAMLQGVDMQHLVSELNSTIRINLELAKTTDNLWTQVNKLQELEGALGVTGTSNEQWAKLSMTVNNLLGRIDGAEDRCEVLELASRRHDSQLASSDRGGTDALRKDVNDLADRVQELTEDKLDINKYAHGYDTLAEGQIRANERHADLERRLRAVEGRAPGATWRQGIEARLTKLFSGEEEIADAVATLASLYNGLHPVLDQIQQGRANDVNELTAMIQAIIPSLQWNSAAQKWELKPAPVLEEEEEEEGEYVSAAAAAFAPDPGVLMKPPNDVMSPEEAALPARQWFDDLDGDAPEDPFEMGNH